MHEFLRELFPICRSLTGNGVRETLQRISNHIPLKTYEVPTGSKAFDWTIPKEWNIRDAYIENEQGEKIVDFQQSNLHVVGYSLPVDKWVDLDELQEHLYSLEELPQAIPYVTSYYNETWGFCLSHNLRQSLKAGRYHVVIDSELSEGSLTYGEYIIPGETDEEVFFSTYVCHPSMANNELSGPVLTTFLAKWIVSQPRKYTYRIIFIPETIGAITYLSRNLDVLKEKVFAGFNVTCVGDEGPYSYLSSREENTYSDRIAQKVLYEMHPDYIHYTYLDRGSDERQYCSPGVDLPVVVLMRSKYRTYPEYHTSLDNLSFVTAKGLQGMFEVYQACIEAIEKNAFYKATCLCEPQLGKRNLSHKVATRNAGLSSRPMKDVLVYSDGKHDLLDISDKINMPLKELFATVDLLKDYDLLTEVTS